MILLVLDFGLDIRAIIASKFTVLSDAGYMTYIDWNSITAS